METINKTAEYAYTVKLTGSEYDTLLEALARKEASPADSDTLFKLGIIVPSWAQAEFNVWEARGHLRKYIAEKLDTAKENIFVEIIS